MTIKITHVIYDFDNTLVNSVDVIINIITQHSRSHGKELPLQIKKELANLGETNYSEIFRQYLDSIGLSDEKVEKFVEQIVKTFYKSKFGLIPGVEKLVKHLYKHNIPMAVATANTKEHYSILNKQFSDFFSKHFSHVVFASDDSEVRNTKPHPDVYFVCADRFEPKPESVENILVVEDSLKGITGAVASGMKTLLINDRKLCDFEEISDKITKICDTFNDFKPESVGLPPYD